MRFGRGCSPAIVVEINGEYEAGSTLGFYLRRQVRILNGRSSNLWYGSFFRDAPQIFDDDASFRRLWSGPQRIFLWTEQDQVPRCPDRLTRSRRAGAKRSSAISRRCAALGVREHRSIDDAALPGCRRAEPDGAPSLDELLGRMKGTNPEALDRVSRLILPSFKEKRWPRQATVFPAKLQIQIPSATTSRGGQQPEITQHLAIAQHAHADRQGQRHPRQQGQAEQAQYCSGWRPRQ